MSATIYTIKDLKELIQNIPDDVKIVSIHPEAHMWQDEGMFDGLDPFMVNYLCEVRTGWNPTTDTYYGTNGPFLVLSTFDKELCEDWWDSDIEDSISKGHKYCKELLVNDEWK